MAVIHKDRGELLMQLRCYFADAPYTEYPTAAMVRVSKGVVKDVVMYGKPIERKDHNKVESVEELRNWASQWEPQRIIELQPGDKIDKNGEKIELDEIASASSKKDQKSKEEKEKDQGNEDAVRHSASNPPPKRDKSKTTNTDTKKKQETKTQNPKAKVEEKQDL